MAVLREIFPSGSIADGELSYTAVIARNQGRWAAVRKQGEETWSFPGGSIEDGETPLEGARRELWEETGALEYQLHLLGQYSVDRGGKITYGNIYYAEILLIGELPASEIEEVRFFSDFPLVQTRFPQIMPPLFYFAQDRIHAQYSEKE
jgi:8-oxo-dGTP diphosphatase